MWNLSDVFFHFSENIFISCQPTASSRLGQNPRMLAVGCLLLSIVIVFFGIIDWYVFFLCYCYLQARQVMGCVLTFIVIFIFRFVIIRNHTSSLFCLACMFKVMYQDSVFIVIILVHVKQSNGQSDGCFLFCRKPSKQQIGENILRLPSPRKKWGKSTYIPT